MKSGCCSVRGDTIFNWMISTVLPCRMSRATMHQTNRKTEICKWRNQNRIWSNFVANGFPILCSEAVEVTRSVLEYTLTSVDRYPNKRNWVRWPQFGQCETKHTVICSFCFCFFCIKNWIPNFPRVRVFGDAPHESCSQIKSFWIRRISSRLLASFWNVLKPDDFYELELSAKWGKARTRRIQLALHIPIWFIWMDAHLWIKLLKE